MTEPSSRFQVVQKPTFDPGEDIITRSTVGPFVDCGVWLQPSTRRRRMLVSVETVREMALAAGIVDDNRATDEQLAKARAEGALDYLRSNLHGDLVPVLEHLARFLHAAGLDLPPGEDAPTAG